jgi:hypothetical protein
LALLTHLPKSMVPRDLIPWWVQGEALAFLVQTIARHGPIPGLVVRA